MLEVIAKPFVKLASFKKCEETVDRGVVASPKKASTRNKWCSVQVGSRTGDTCVTSELRFSAVVQVLEEARRLSRRTNRKVNCKAKRGTRGPSLKTTR